MWDVERSSIQGLDTLGLCTWIVSNIGITRTAPQYAPHSLTDVVCLVFLQSVARWYHHSQPLMVKFPIGYLCFGADIAQS